MSLPDSKMCKSNGVSNQPAQKELQFHNHQLLPCRHRISKQLIHVSMAPRGSQIQPQLRTNLLYAKELCRSSWKPWMPTLSNEPNHTFTVLNSWPCEGSIAVRVHKNWLHRDGLLMKLFILFPHKLAEYKYGIDFACLTVVVMETIQVL